MSKGGDEGVPAGGLVVGAWGFLDGEPTHLPSYNRGRAKGAEDVVLMSESLRVARQRAAIAEEALSAIRKLYVERSAATVTDFSEGEELFLADLSVILRGEVSGA